MSIQDIYGYLTSTPATGFQRFPADASGQDASFIQYTNFLGEKQYYVFSTAALRVVALSDAVAPSKVTNIFLYSVVGGVVQTPMVEAYSKDRTGILQYEGEGNQIYYLAYGVNPSIFVTDTSGYDPNTAFNVVLVAEDNTTSTFNKESGTAVLQEPSATIFTVFDESGFLQAASGVKLVNGLPEPIVTAGGVIKYVKTGVLTEYYQKSAAGHPFFKQVADASGTALSVGPTIWREYGTNPDAIVIGQFAIDDYYAVGDSLVSSGPDASGVVLAPRTFVRTQSNLLTEDVSGEASHWFPYNNSAFKYTVENAATGIVVNDMRLASSGERDHPLYASGIVYTVHASQTLLRNATYYAYSGAAITESEFSTNNTYAVADKLYFMAAYNAMTNDDLAAISSAFKKAAYGLNRIMDISGSLTSDSSAYNAYNHNGLKNAAALISVSHTVNFSGDAYTKTELNVLLLGTTYYAYLGAVTRRQFATDLVSGSQKFAFHDTLKQRTVISDSSISDTTFYKIASNAVNAVDESLTYVYGDLGMLGAARNNVDTYTTTGAVKLVDVMDSLTAYTKSEANVLRYGSTEYFEYDNLQSISLERFTATDVMFNVSDVLYKRDTTTGAAVQNYTKVMAAGVTRVASSTTFLTFSASATEAATTESGSIVPIDATIDESSGSLVVNKRVIGAWQGTGSSITSWKAYTFTGLAGTSYHANFNNSSHQVEFVAVIPSVTYAYRATKELKVVGQQSYLAFDQVVTEAIFATDSAGYSYPVGADLVQRSSSATSASSDVVIDKLAVRLVNTTADVSGSHAYGTVGLLSAAKEADASRLKQATVFDIEDGSKPYAYLVQYVLKNGADYYEYNALATVSLEQFTQTGLAADTSAAYLVGDKLKKQSVSDGSNLAVYEKVLATSSSGLEKTGTSKDLSDNTFYTFSEFALRDAVLEAGGVVPIDASVSASGVMIRKRIIGAWQGTSSAVSSWKSYSYVALAAVAAYNDVAGVSGFIAGHSVTFVPVFAGEEIVYDFHLRNALKVAAAESYLAFTDVITEAIFATNSAGYTYPVAAVLRKRSAVATSDASDIVIDKLAVRLVNTTADVSGSHAYGTVGLLSAAKEADSSRLKQATVFDIEDGSKSYAYLVQYVLKNGADYYEYNALATVSLEQFTQTGLAADTSAAYLVGDKLKKQSVSDGSNLAVYEKVLATSSSGLEKTGTSKDLSDNTFYTFSEFALRDAVLEAGGIVPIDASVSASGVMIRKRIVGAWQGTSSAVSSWKSYSYVALAAVSAIAGFVSGHQVTFVPSFAGEETVYDYHLRNALKVHSAESYLAFTDVITEASFATNSAGYTYPVGADLRKRDPAATSDASDIVIDKLEVRLVNTTADASGSHAYGTRGLLSAANELDNSRLKLSTVFDIEDGSKQYSYLVQYVLKSGTSYYEYNALETITLEQFTQTGLAADTGAAYLVGDKLKRQSMSTGADITTYEKVLATTASGLEKTGTSKNLDDSKFYVFSEFALRDAVLEAGSVVPIDAAVSASGTMVTKRIVGAWQGTSGSISSWKSYSFVALAEVAAYNDVSGLTGFIAGHSVTFVPTFAGQETPYNFHLRNALKEAAAESYLAFSDVITEAIFATNSAGYTYPVAAVLRKRSPSATSAASDIVIDKLEVRLVNTTADASASHAYGARGLLSAAKEVDNSRLKLSTVLDIEDASRQYSYLVQYVLKSGTSYYEYNALQTITLEQFTQTGLADDTSAYYLVGDRLKRQNVSTGADVATYEKVLATDASGATGTSKNLADSTFYTFSELALRDAVLEVGSVVPIDASVSASGTMVSKRIVGAWQGTGSAASSWKSYSYVALAEVAAYDDNTGASGFVAGHQVTFVPVYAGQEIVYSFHLRNALKVTTAESYLAFTDVITEAIFAINSAGYTYPVAAVLRKRSPSATSATSDIVIDKLEVRLVNTTADASGSHAYGTEGLLSAANEINSSRLKQATVFDIEDGSKQYTYLVQYVLKNGADYYEYNDLATISLEQFTQTGLAADTAAAYLVGDKLKKQSMSDGSNLAVYEKVLATSSSGLEKTGTSKDLASQIFYTFSEFALRDAILEASGVVPIDASVSASGTLVTKRVAGVWQGTSSASSSWKAYSYVALAATAAYNDASGVSGFVASHQVAFVPTFGQPAVNYVFHLRNALEDVDTPTFIAFTDVITEQIFATNSNGKTYSNGSTLLKRSPLATSAVADTIIYKVDNRLVNTNADANASHAYGDQGLRNAAWTAQADLVNSAVKDILDSAKFYSWVEQYVLKSGNDYYEYDALQTITLAGFTETGVAADTGVAYLVGDKLKERNSMSGAAVEEFEKIMSEGVSKRQSDSRFYTFSSSALQAAVEEDTAGTRKVPVDAVIDATGLLVIKRLVGAYQESVVVANWRAYSYVALAGVAAYSDASGAVGFISGHQVEFVAVSPAVTYDFYMRNALRVGDNFISYQVGGLDTITENSFAIGSVYVAGAAILAQRMPSATSPAADVVINKIAERVVNNNQDGFASHAYGPRGLRNAANESATGSSGGFVLYTSIKDMLDNELTYTYLEQYLLKQSTNYFEYNGLATLTLQNFTDGVTYDTAVGDILKKQDQTSGINVDNYEKVMKDMNVGVSKDLSANDFYVYNESSLRAAVLEDTPVTRIVPLDAFINAENGGSAVIVRKRLVGAYQGTGSATAGWKAYSYLALAGVAGYSALFVAGHWVDFAADENNIVSYNFWLVNALVETNDSSKYLSFTVSGVDAITEGTFATVNGTYFAADVLTQRSSLAQNASADIVISKLAENLINTTADVSGSHAYSNLGLRNAAVRPAPTGLIEGTVYDISDNSKIYTYYAQYVLSTLVAQHTEYYEYSAAHDALSKQTFTLTNIYAVGDILRQRGPVDGEAVADFEKVMPNIASAGVIKDLSANDFYVYDALGKEQAVTEDTSGGMIVPIDALIHSEYEGISIYKRLVGAYQEAGTATSWQAYTYLALAGVAAYNDASGTTGFIATHQVYFTVADLTYQFHLRKALKEVTANNYVAYEEAITEATFAISSTYDNTTAVLRQRLSSATSDSADVVISKLDERVVETTADTAKHAYGNLGLRNAANLTLAAQTEIKDIEAASRVYTYLAYRLLSSAGSVSNTEYFEYSGLQTALTLETFTTDSTYLVADILRKRDETSGAAVDNFEKVISSGGVSKDLSANDFYTYNATGTREAVVDGGSIVPVAAYINQAISGTVTVLIKRLVGAYQEDVDATVWRAYTYLGLGGVAINTTGFASGHTVMFDLLGAGSIPEYAYDASSVIVDIASGKDYIAFDGAVSEQTFATSSYYVSNLQVDDTYQVGAGANLVQRSSSDDTDANDVIINKLAPHLVNTSLDMNESHAYGPLGLRNSAVLASSDANSALRQGYKIKDASGSVSGYEYQEQYVLKNSTVFYEYNNLATLTIQEFTTDDSTYPVSTTLKKQDTVSGVDVDYFSKVILGVTQHAALQYFYTFADAATESAVMDGGSIVAIDAVINESGVIHRKRLIGAYDTSGSATGWKAYTYVALAGVSYYSTFVAGSQVLFAVDGLTYEFVMAKALKDTASNTYVCYEDASGLPVISETSFATSGSYPQTGQLRQRLLASTSDASDVVIDKLDYNLTNSSLDSNASHAYGDLGLRNAAVRQAPTGLISNTVIDKQDSDKSYSYIAQYVLKSGSIDWYEYSALQTGLTLETFTTDNITYVVGHFLHERSALDGSYVMDYTKVIAGITQKYDGALLAYYYTFNATDRQVAVDEDGTIVFIPSVINESGTEYNKTAPGSASVAGSNDWTANTYLALYAVAANGAFGPGNTVQFTAVTPALTYEYYARKVLRQLGTEKYVSYTDASGAFLITRKSYATGVYGAGAGAELRQRLPTATSNVDDIVMNKIAQNAVNTAQFTGATFAYANLGLRGAARFSTKAVVRLVTADEYSAGESMTEYVKVSDVSNVLRLGVNYYEYDDLASITLRGFSTSGSYVAGNIINSMNSSTGALVDSYMKMRNGVMLDGTDAGADPTPLYYVYTDLSGAAIAPVEEVPIGQVMVDIPADVDNEPSGTQVNANSYTKRARGLLQRVSANTVFTAFSQLGLASAATGVLVSGQNVTYEGETWNYFAANVMKKSASSIYISFMDYASALSESSFATSSTYLAADQLLQRTLSSLTDHAAVATDVTLTKKGVNLVNASNDAAASRAYGDLGLLTAAYLTLADLINGQVKNISDASKTYAYSQLYVLRGTGSETNKYYEYNDLNTINIRTLTTAAYNVGDVLNRMNTTTGAFVSSATKVYTDIALANNGSYYCYVTASLRTIAGEPNTSVLLGSVIYDVSGNKEPVGSDLVWSKNERYVLRRTYGSAYLYRSYDQSGSNGIPVDEFAGSPTYATGDRLEIDLLGQSLVTYDRVANATLRLLGDVSNNYLAYSYTVYVSVQNDLAGAANSDAVPLLSTVVRKTAGDEVWIKDASGLMVRSSVYNSYSAVGSQIFADKTLSYGTVLNEYFFNVDSYIWAARGILMNGTGPIFYYVYATGNLSLNTFACNNVTYLKGDVLVDRSVNHDGPHYVKLLAEGGALGRSPNRSAGYLENDIYTFEAAGVNGLKNASLAEVNDISDGTILIPEVSSGIPNHLRCAKAVLRQLIGTSKTSFSTNVKVFETSLGESPVSALRLVARNQDASGTAFTTTSVIPVESNIYMQAYDASGYNTSTIAYVKDSSPFTYSLRVGTAAVTDKIAFIDASENTIRTTVFQNFSEQESSAGSKTAKFAGHTLTVRTAGSDTVYTVSRLGLLRTGGVGAYEYHTFSENGLISAAAAATDDANQTIEYHLPDYTSQLFYYVQKGLLRTNNRLGGVSGEDVAIIYLGDYNVTKDDDKENMYAYMHRLAVSGSVGSTLTDTDSYIRDGSGNIVLDVSGADGIIDSVSDGTITKLYSIVNKVGGSYYAEKYETVSYTDASSVVQRLAATLKVTPIDTSGVALAPTFNAFYMAYGTSGVNKTSAAAVEGLTALANAPLEVIPVNSIIYTGDRYSVDTTAANQYTKAADGLLNGPSLTLLTYSEAGLQNFSHYSQFTGRTYRHFQLPVGVAGTSGSAGDRRISKTTFGGKDYFWWEKGVVLDMSGSEQNFSVWTASSSGASTAANTADFVRRCVLAESSGLVSANDYADTQVAGKAAYAVGSRITFKLAPVTVYVKSAHGLLLNETAATYYALNDYGLAVASNMAGTTSILRINDDQYVFDASNGLLWNVPALGVVRNSTNSTVWRLYSNSGLAAGKEFFALNSDLNDSLSAHTYSGVSTPAVHVYQNIVDSSMQLNGYDASGNKIVLGTTPTSIIKITDVVQSGLVETADDVRIFQTYGFAGLSLLANTASIPGFLLKDTEIQVMAITGNASNAVSGLYKKLADGAVYKEVGSVRDIMLFDLNQLQPVFDRIDIDQFSSIDTRNGYAVDISGVTLINPINRLVNTGNALESSSYRVDLVATGDNGETITVSYNARKVVERQLMSGLIGTTQVFTQTNVQIAAPADNVKEFTVFHKRSFPYKEIYRVRTIIDYYELLSA